MELHIEFYNTIASLGWAFVVLSLVGMIIVKKNK